MARGGKREGAGRPTGTNWKPAAKALRHDAVEKAAAIVNAGDDPLTVVAGWVLDTSLDPNFRLSAANACLPFLYPKLSASHVDTKMTVTKIDTADLLHRLDERLSRLAQPATIEATVEAPPLAIEIEPEEAE